MIRSLFTAAALFASAGALAADTLKMAVTTSFHNSGLSDVLLPEIQKDLGLEVQLIVVGTGQAIRLGEAGDVDAILVHSRKAEEKFLEGGYGTHRREIMYNDFVLVGPSDDPAKIATTKTVKDALVAIAEGLRPLEEQEWDELVTGAALGELDAPRSGRRELGSGAFDDGTRWIVWVEEGEDGSVSVELAVERMVKPSLLSSSAMARTRSPATVSALMSR